MRHYREWGEINNEKWVRRQPDRPALATSSAETWFVELDSIPLFGRASRLDAAISLELYFQSVWSRYKLKFMCASSELDTALLSPIMCLRGENLIKFIGEW